MESKSDGEQYWRQLAETHWLKVSKRAPKARPEVIKKEIWDVLEKVDFDFRALLTLDNLQLLEKLVLAVRCK